MELLTGPVMRRMRRRWEVVATMTGRHLTWVMPETVGLHYRWTRLGAWWTARRWTADAQRLGNVGPVMVWVVRKAL